MDQFSNPRELRGLKILSEPDTIISMGKNEWDVRSHQKMLTTGFLVSL